MKKITALLIMVIFLFEVMYAYTPVKCKASYVAGSLNIRLKEKGILEVGESSLVFIYRGYKYEIPYENIKQMQYSKKKNSFQLGSLQSILPPKPNFRTYTEYDTFSGPSIGQIILGIAALALLVVLLIISQKDKYVYLNVVFEKEGETNWATFKIKKDHFQKIFLTLSSKSDKDIVEIF